MKTRLLSLAGLAALLSLVCAIATASQIETETTTRVFRNGLEGYSGAFEVGIRKGNGVLENTAANLWVSRKYANSTLEDEEQALVRFDGIFGENSTQIPPGATVTKATLRLCVGALAGATSYHRIFLSRMLVAWDANAAWNYTAWGNDGIQANGSEAVSAPDAHFVPNLNNTAYEIDVTESLRAWAGGAPNHGWVLRDIRDQPVRAAFICSRLKITQPPIERRPTLIVSYDTQPANNAPLIGNLTATHKGNGSAVLSLNATDTDNNPLTVTLYGRKRAKAGPDFEIILLPDTQYYTRQTHGGTPAMLNSQIDWIIGNREARNIAFALQLGDLTDAGDILKDQEWPIISNALLRLEDPAATGLPEGIPYVVNVGNHDQRYRDANNVSQDNGPAAYYNKYFGTDRFAGKSYYGGNFGPGNNNYYALLEGGDEKFIVISLEYNFAARNPDAPAWADALLTQHADRRAIVVTHSALFPGVPGNFTDDGGKAAYDTLKHHKNLMLIIGGHITGEGRRTDVHDGSVIHSIVQDFQLDGSGGNGWLGILTFSPRNNQLRVATYSPYINQWRDDSAAKYTLDYDFGTQIEPFAKLDERQVAAGGNLTYNWKNLSNDDDYEWYAEVTDGQKTTRSDTLVITPVKPAPANEDERLLYALSNNYTLTGTGKIVADNPGSLDHLPKTHIDENGTLSITFTPIRETLTYEVQQSGDLRTWETVEIHSGNSSLTEPVSVQSNPTPGEVPRLFLRLKISAPAE